MILKKEKKKGSPSSAYNIQYIETKMKEEQKNKRKDSNKEKRKKEKKIWFTQNRTLVTEQGALAVPPWRKDVPWPVLPGYVKAKAVEAILKIAHTCVRLSVIAMIKVINKENKLTRYSYPGR